jgi:hypothetical protein
MTRRKGLEIICLVVLAIAALCWKRSAVHGIKARRPLDVQDKPVDKTTWPEQRAQTAVRAAALTGSVRDDHGAAISKASVCLWSSADGAPGQCTATDAKGRFALGDAGLGTLAVQAEGFADQILNINLQPNDLIIVLRPAPALRGRVVDAFGGVVGGARVVLTPDTSNAPGMVPEIVALTTTNERGQFRFGSVEKRVEVHASADGYAAGQVGAWIPGPEVQVTLAPASSIRGKVTDAASTPVSGITVTARREGHIGGLSKGITDGEGRFALSVAVGGTYMVELSADDWDAAPTSVAVGMGANGADITLVASRTLALDGRVLVGEEPCSGGEVTLHGPATRTAPILPSGRVRLGKLSAGSYTSEVHCKDAVTVSDTLELRTNVTSKVWHVSPGASLWGTLRSARGEPRSGIDIRVDPDESQLVPLGFRSIPGAPVALPARCTTDDGGKFRCSGLTPGSYVCALHAGLRDLGTQQVTISTEDVRVEWTLPAGGSVRATTPAGTNVDSVVADGGEFVFGERKADNSFWFEDLAPGNYAIRYINEDVGQTVNVTDGTVALVELGPVVTELLAGRVVDASNNPLPDAWVTARLARTSLLATQTVAALTNGAGEFQFPQVPRGEYMVRVESAGGKVTTAVRTGTTAVLRVVPQRTISPLDHLAVREEGALFDLGFLSSSTKKEGVEQ